MMSSKQFVDMIRYKYPDQSTMIDTGNPNTDCVLFYIVAQRAVYEPWDIHVYQYMRKDPFSIPHIVYDTKHDHTHYRIEKYMERYFLDTSKIGWIERGWFGRYNCNKKYSNEEIKQIHMSYFDADYINPEVK